MKGNELNFGALKFVEAAAGRKHASNGLMAIGRGRGSAVTVSSRHRGALRAKAANATGIDAQPAIPSPCSALSNHISPCDLSTALESMDCAGDPGLAAIRDWLLAGQFLKLHEHSLGAAAKAAAARAFFCESENVERFIAEECETRIADGQLLARTSERTTDLHAVYVEWCSAKGREPISLTAFGRELSRLGFPWRKNRNGQKFRQGLRLRTSAPDQKAA